MSFPQPQRRYDTWLAQRIASLAHYGQKDKAGFDYIRHPEAVVDILVGPAYHPAYWSAETLDLAICVALLHDVVEDTSFTYDDLARFGMPEQVLSRVRLLTRLPGESNEAYYARVRQDEITLYVKLAEVGHNGLESRLAMLEEATRDRLRLKYSKARTILTVAPTPEPIRR